LIKINILYFQDKIYFYEFLNQCPKGPGLQDLGLVLHAKYHLRSFKLNIYNKLILKFFY